MNFEVIKSLILREKATGLFYGPNKDGLWGKLECGKFLPIPSGPVIDSLVSYATGFECQGYFETLTEPTPGGGWHDLGTRTIDYPAERGFGSGSGEYITLHKPFELTKGFKAVKYKPRTPWTVFAVASVLCGRKLPSGWVPEGFEKVSE